MMVTTQILQLLTANRKYLWLNARLITSFWLESFTGLIRYVTYQNLMGTLKMLTQNKLISVSAVIQTQMSRCNR